MEESNTIKEKLDKAFKKLWTHDFLFQKSLRSSHYNFGIEKPFVNDRCNFAIKLGTSIVKCQIIFDPNNYNLPPDILFRHLPSDVTKNISDISTLLPNKDFDLNNEECLYIWFQRILKLIVKEPAIEEKEKSAKHSIFFENDDDDIFEDQSRKKSSHDLDINSKDEEEKPKKTWSIFNDNHNVDIDMCKDEKEEKPVTKEEKEKFSLFDDKSDNVDIFEQFKNDKKKEKKANVANSNKQEDTRSKISDVEFVDNDYLKYNSSCDIVDTTVDRKDDMDIDDMTDKTKDREYTPDVEIISPPTPSKSKEKSKIKEYIEEKPIGRISANLAALKNKSRSPEISSIDVDESLFDFPTSSSSLLVRKTASPKRQSTISASFKSPQRSEASAQSGYTIEKRRKDIVDLIFDDNDDDFEEILPPPKIRKSENQTKIFDLNTSKSPQRSDQRRSRLQSTEQIRSNLTEKGQSILINTGSRMKSQEEYRKKFMTAWLHRFKDNIIEYDTEKLESFSFYFTFGLLNTSQIWTQFRTQVEMSDDTKISCKPKLHAPVLVQFKMDRYFPTSNLKIKVISVLNTTYVASEEPEVLDLQYKVDEDDVIANTIEKIMNILKSKVPAFHCQVKETYF